MRVGPGCDGVEAGVGRREAEEMRHDIGDSPLVARVFSN